MDISCPICFLMINIFLQVVKLRDFSSAGAYSFLKALIEQNAPKPGKSITVKYINPKIGNLVDVHVERVTAGVCYFLSLILLVLQLRIGIY